MNSTLTGSTLKRSIIHQINFTRSTRTKSTLTRSTSTESTLAKTTITESTLATVNSYGINFAVAKSTWHLVYYS